MIARMKKLQGKFASESQVEVTHLVQPSNINAIGTIFGGTVMSWIDLAAAACANRHTRSVCVTASMDALDFLAPIHLGDIVIIRAQVNYTHNTSLEVGVRVESENPLTGETRHTASAYLTFVALSKGKPTAVPPLTVKTAIEKQRYKEAEQRREFRMSSLNRRKSEKAKK